MDEGQEKWSKQFWSNFGSKEFLRAYGVFFAWILLGVLLALIAGSPGAEIILTVFVGTLFAFMLLGRWQPVYRIYRAILGNKNLPPEPMPRRTRNIPTIKRPWWAYLPGIWGCLMALLLMYLAFKYLTR
jgi:hypothetical protein